MRNAEVGMRVEANLAGLTVGGVPCGEGWVAPGTVIAIDSDRHPAIVRLEVAFGVVDTVSLEGWRLCSGRATVRRVGHSPEPGVDSATRAR
jgi:hypothetical protein